MPSQRSSYAQRLFRTLSAHPAPKPKLRPRQQDPLMRPLIKEMLGARYRAGLTQQGIAERLCTTRSAISRLESGKFHWPTFATLQNYATVTGCRIEIRFRTVYSREALDYDWYDNR